MRTLLLGICITTLALAGCGGEPVARVKGRIVENGQPKTFAATSHSVEITPVSVSGEPNKNKSFTAVVNEDGSFEVLASDGKLPLGSYLFSVRGPSISKKSAAPGATPPAARRELKDGVNEIVLDLAKPNE